AAGGDGQTENSGSSGADPGNSGPAGGPSGGGSASGPGGGLDPSQGTIPSGPGDYLHEVRPVGPGYEEERMPPCLIRRCRRGGNFGAAEKLGRLAPLQSREFQRRREVRNGFAHSRKCIAA